MTRAEGGEEGVLFAFVEDDWCTGASTALLKFSPLSMGIPKFTEHVSRIPTSLEQLSYTASKGCCNGWWLLFSRVKAAIAPAPPLPGTVK